MKQKLLLTLAFLCAVAQGAIAQETLTVCEGTESSGYVPVYGYYVDNYSRSQFVIPASYLTEMKDGAITKLTFYASQSSIDWGKATFTVYLKEVEETTLSSLCDWNTLEKVYEGSLAVSDNQMAITFSLPYEYGGGNLLIGINQTMSGSYASSSWYGVAATGASLGGYGTGISQQNFLPKTTFTYEGAKACQKPTDLMVSAITTQGATVTWQSEGARWNLQYKAVDAEEWISVNGLTQATYTLTGLAEGTSYNVRVQTDCGDDTSYWRRATFTTVNSVITIGSGTSTNAYVPFSFSSAYSFSQQIYTVEELGTTPCAFTSIDFYETSKDISSEMVDIYMTETDKTKFSDQYDWGDVQDYTLVYSGAVTFTKDSWTTVTFDTPYYYDGKKNVLLVVHDRKGTTGSTVSFRVCSSSYGQALCAYRYQTPDFDLSDMTGIKGSFTDGKNQIRLRTADYPTCLRPATVAVSDIAPYTATVTWEGAGDKWNLRYKQPSDGEWTTIEGLTGMSSVLTSLTQDATYYVGVQTDCGGGNVSPWKYATFKTAEAVPTPSGLECTGYTASTASLSWKENGTATAWEISVLDASSSETIIAAASNPFTVIGLTEDIVYTFKVRATQGDMHSHWTDAVSVQPTDKLCLGLDGTATHSSLPWNSNSQYSLSQQLYTVTELGATPCSISGVDFYLSGSTALKRNVEIYMLLTDKSSFSSGYYTSNDWVPFTADDLVFSGEVQSVRNAWTSVMFDTPFMYDGQHNVLIVVYNKTGSSHSGISWKTYETSDYQALYGLGSYEIDPANLSSLNGYAAKGKNRIRLVTGAYNACPKPTAITVSNITANSATVSWTSEASAWDVMLDGTVVATAITTKTYEFTGLEMASVHEVQVRTNCGGGSVSPWSNAVSFNTILCSDEDKCSISYDLSISSEYYDEWYGCAIQVMDALTGELLASWTVTEGGKASGTLAVCNGRQIMFKWKEGDASERCVYSVQDNNGDLILSGQGKLKEPVTYTIDCTPHLPKPVDFACTRSVAPKATLTWTEKGTATHWQISLLEGSSVEKFIDVTQNPYTLTGLTGETTYTAKVRSMNGEEVSKWSDAITFEVTTATPIGTGTNTDDDLPLNNWFKYSLTEQIYTASELGDEAKSIETLAFYNTYTDVERNLDIYMAVTDKEEFSNYKDWVTVSEGDLVFSGTVTFANNAWTTITLDTPFEYDGKSNMLLVVDDNSGISGSTAYFYSFNDDKYRSIYYRNSNTNLTPRLSLSDISGNITKTRNQIRLLMNPPTAVPKPAAFRSTWAYSHSAWLRWEEKGKATKWQLSVLDNSLDDGQNGESQAAVEKLIDVEKNPYLLEGLSPEREYTVKVRSVYNGQYSRWTGPITITTTANEEPWGLEADQIGPNSAVLTWYDEDYVKAWQICIDGDEEHLIDVAEKTYTLTGLAPETKYTVKVRSVIPNEHCPWSDDFDFTTTEVNPVPRNIEMMTTHTTATAQWLGFSDSYNVQYRKAAGITPLFADGFENGIAGCTLRNCTENTGYFESSDYAHTGNCGFIFSFTENPPQQLISPQMDGITEGMKLQFYYRNFSSEYPETFQIGFSSTTNDDEAFAYGDVITATDTEWTLFRCDIPVGTKYISLKHTSYDQWFLLIDDIAVGVETEAGEWQTVSVTEALVTITGLTAGTNYDLQVQGVVNDASSAWSPTKAFATQLATTKLFVTDGEWNDADCWTPVGVPTATDDVVIMAHVTIPSGLTATARSISYEGDTSPIIIKDGGQLRHNTEELYVTVEKTVKGYGSGKGNYLLLANPLGEEHSGSYPGEVGMEQGSYDLYSFEKASEDGLEWRNYKREDYSLLPNSDSGYLYANSADQTLSFSGWVGSTPADVSKGISVYVDDKSAVTPFTNGWRIFANNAVSNAYVQYGTYDDESNFTPSSANFYKMNATGDGFTLYKDYAVVTPGEAIFVETPVSGWIRYSYDPLSTTAPVAEAVIPELPRLPVHGKNTHQDAHLLPPVLGDVNGDGVVDMTDAVAVVNYLLGLPSEFTEEALDVNKDGYVTITDAVKVVNKIQGNE